MSKQFPNHRHLVGVAKAAALQRDRNFWPGMLLSDYDWSENGVIASARQIQSEYWSLTYYSLFIQITTYLVSSAWLDRRSLLAVDTEVTVELNCDEFGQLEPAKGAFYAKVHSAPSQEGEGGLYSVKVYGHAALHDGEVVSDVPRERLRHRKKQTTATIGITDEKRHDSHTTQHFLDKQFAEWEAKLDKEKFWAWLGHSDNATHFKLAVYISAISRPYLCHISAISRPISSLSQQILDPPRLYLGCTSAMSWLHLPP